MGNEFDNIVVRKLGYCAFLSENGYILLPFWLEGGHLRQVKNGLLIKGK